MLAAAATDRSFISSKSKGMYSRKNGNDEQHNISFIIINALNSRRYHSLFSCEE